MIAWLRRLFKVEHDRLHLEAERREEQLRIELRQLRQLRAQRRANGA
jgi:hypothetical protein